MENENFEPCILCERPQWCRGLCTRDYQVALHKVNKEGVTWQELVDMKLALPHKWEKGVSEFSKRFNRMKKR